jgi:hypothetical protein
MSTKILGVTESSKFAQPAMIRTFNGLIPVKDIVEVTKDIFKGEIVTPEQAEVFGKTVFFSRVYDASNTLDQMLKEYYIDDLSLLGFPFYLIPKDKALFQYEPASNIIRPTGSFKPRKPQ